MPATDSTQTRQANGAGGASHRLFQRALVALPAGPGAAVVHRSVLARLRPLDCDLLLVHVVLRPTSAPGNESDGAPATAEETETLRELRAAAVAELGDRGHSLAIRILHGDAGQRICEYAEFTGCDGIVLGPRERASFAKALRGSVSKYVLANSRRTLLVLGD
jgi:nucleotide-binding universal stress UspA family protein